MSNPRVAQQESGSHVLQFYGADQGSFIRNVGVFLRDGLERGDSLLAIATTEHQILFQKELDALGCGATQAIHDGRLVFRDAAETLASVMPGDQLDWESVERTLGEAVAALQRTAPRGRLRVYGELVGLLWSERKFAAAIQLETFWRKLLESNELDLFCAYPIDVFGKQFSVAEVDELLQVHTHVVSSGEGGALENAIILSLSEKLRESGALSSGASLPDAEAAILLLRRAFPDQADAILSRAREIYSSERRFRALIENNADAISLLNERGKIIYASAATTNVLGFESPELVGVRGLDLIHPDDVEGVAGRFRKALQTPRAPQHLLVRMRHKDGNWRWVEGTFSNLLDEPDVLAVVMNCRDVSGWKSAEEARIDSAAQLARSKAEFHAFAHAAAHDLKEPLSTIRGYTQLLVERTELDAHGNELANFVFNGVNRLTSMLDDMLAFSTLTFDEAPVWVDLNRVIDLARKNLQRALEESAAVIATGVLPTVQGRETHLLRLFQNLFGNAIKYRSDAAVQIHVTATQEDRQFVFRVKDNGIGISPEYHEHVFGLFKRLDHKDIPGTGLGLAICKKIVEDMGGRIWVESELGVGAEFFFTLPISTGASEAPFAAGGSGQS